MQSSMQVVEESDPMVIDSVEPSAPQSTMTAHAYPPSSEPDVGFVYDTEMTLHCSPDGHPEAPERILRIWKALVSGHYISRAKVIPTRQVLEHEALLVHSQKLWDKVEAIQYMTQPQFLDSEEHYEQLSLYICAATTLTARLSCGGVIEACLAVARGELSKTFAVVRPPGHHAEPEEHMGFCFFNNVAVAARVVQNLTPLKKILILDWDVHHGNGTQRAFNSDPSVLFISLHRHDGGDFYPYGPFGDLDSCGEGLGLGYSVNIPWPENGMGDADYIHAFQKVIMPIATEFDPELVIISAGFDAAEGDDLGECLVTPVGYAHMTYMLAGLAGGRLAVALEGGYNLDSITKSALAVTEIIMGGAPPEMGPMVASEAGARTVWLVARQQSQYWKSLNARACEPEGLPCAAASYSSYKTVVPTEANSPPLPTQEILKLHRQHYMYSEHGMMEVPLVSAELEQRFSGQVICSPDVFQCETLVFVVHEFGNLRVEMSASVMRDAQLERANLIEFSKDLVTWVKAEGYSLLDVNLFPKPNGSILRPKTKSIRALRQEVITYVWDNYVMLSSGRNIVLVGHGPACQQLMDLIDMRETSVVESVRSVIQVVGHWPPCLPSRPENLKWYRCHSFLALGCDHSIRRKVQEVEWHGHVLDVDEDRSVALFAKALPDIKRFVKAQLSCLK
ncbi:histone deacetylase complex protein [Favolaschia claudopus]|uniref:histone deacetylase n=1 Tax=Favolaschia claudopus TaxID=2862362 RepID=A0AAW0BKF5_9AGAR